MNGAWLPRIDLRFDFGPAAKLGAAAVVLLFPLAGFLLLTGDGEAAAREAQRPDEIVLAWQACRDAVAGKLLRPDTATFPASASEVGASTGRARYRFEGTVESDNDRGDRVSNRFVCRAQRSNGKWATHVLDLSFAGQAGTSEGQSTSA